MTRRAALPFLLIAPLALPLFGCGDSAAEGAVAVPGASAPEVLVRVRTARTERAALAAGQRVAGTVRAFHEATVKAEISGRVLRRAVERGDTVARGAVLIELDASRLELELRQAEAALRARRTDLAHAKREHERGERLVARDAISEQHRDDLQHALDVAQDAYALALVARDTAKRLLEDATIRAPIDGRVDDLLVNVGDFVSPATPVAHVLDLSRARVFGGVTAEEAARLTPEMDATASFASLGGLVQEAELKSIARAADPEDGTYRIELWIDAPDPRIRDGLVASLELDGGSDETRVLAPRVSLIRSGGRSQVFVVERAPRSAVGTARRRTVRTGRSGGERVEILEGLEAGDEVVIDGQFALRDGAAVVVDGAPTSATPREARPE